MQKTTYDPLKDFTYIIQLSGFVLATAVLADGPFKVWKDVIDYARAIRASSHMRPQARRPASISAWR
jgi:tripartite-type tricarboxylate transporter receptor subunit TctC